MKLEELVLSKEYYSEKDISSIEICEITTDAEKIKSNTLFVFIKSIKFDSDKIINKVIEKNPKAILCGETDAFYSVEIPVLRCKDTRKMLSFVYSRFYKIDFSKTDFIAVTGTNGKTTTSTMIAHILTHCRHKVGFIGTGKIIVCGELISNSDYSMTTPDPEYLYQVIKLMQDKECRFIVMEVSSHALFFEKTAPIPFKVTLFTNLSAEHLDFHKSIEEYFATKMKIFGQTEYGIFNFDDPYSKRAYHLINTEKSAVGITNKADAMATEINSMGLMGSEYQYEENGTSFKVKLALGGKFNIYNSLMAIKTARNFGATPEEIASALLNLEYIDGRLEIIKDEITVVIDYAHTELAFEEMLNFLFSNKKQGQKLIVVFGCGGERDKGKRPKMGSSAEKYSDLALVTSDNPRGEDENEIIKDILAGFTSSDKRVVITSRALAIEYAVMNANQGDIVAIIGKGHERYCCDKSGVHAFDERDIVKRALKKRRDNL